MTESRPAKDPGLAAVLSLIVPGIGQFYAGHWLWGIFWLVVTPGFWIGTGGLLGWVCHVLAAVQAHRQVVRRPYG
jgi:TM2 domain-containing membrane protein YozV